MKRNLRIVALAAIAVYVFFWWRNYRIRTREEQLAAAQKNKQPNYGVRPGFNTIKRPA